MSDEDESKLPRGVSASHIVATAVSFIGRALVVLAIGFAIRMAADAIEPFAGEDTLVSMDLSVAMVLSAAIAVPGLWAALKLSVANQDRLRRKLRNYVREIWELEKRNKELEREVESLKDQRPIDDPDSDDHDGEQGGAT